MSASRVLSVSEWNPSAVRYMQPRVNDRGGKGITIISNQTGRSLHLSTPLLMTWGVSDYTDEKTGESDGKFTMSLNFARPLSRVREKLVSSSLMILMTKLKLTQL